MRTGVIDDIVAKHIPHDAYPEAWDTAGLKNEVVNKLNLDLPVDEWAKEEGIADEEVATRLHAAAADAYTQRVQRNTPDAMRYVEKQVILQSLDHLWREHLVTLDHLRQVIGWRGMAQRDPLNEYKSEAFELFRELIAQWHEAVIAQMSRIEVTVPAARAAAADAVSASRPRHRRKRTAVRSPFRAGRRRSPGGDVRACGRRPRPEEPCDLGASGTKRTLSVRLGQEVQTLPRSGRLTIARRFRRFDPARRSAHSPCRNLRGLWNRRPEAGGGADALRGIRRRAGRADRRSAGAARAGGREDRGIRGEARGGRAAVEDRRQARILGANARDYDRMFSIRGLKLRRSSRSPSDCSAGGAKNRCACSTSASAQARSCAPCS